MFTNAACRHLSALLLLATSSVVLTADTSGQENAVATENATDGFRCVGSEQSLAIYRGDAEVLRYNITAPKAPEGIKKEFERSGYIHPIFSPRGRLVTGDFAADHPHQHGLFVAWTNTSFRGTPVDFWNQLKAIGVVLHDRVISTRASKDAAELVVAVKHYAIANSGERTAILDDVWKINVSLESNQDGGADDERYLIDFSTQQTNITEHPLSINEYHYGGIGFRGNNAWYSDESAKALGAFVKQPDAEPLALQLTRHRFLTSEGNDRRLGNHSRPEWTALYGLVDEESVAGVRVRPSQDNTHYPDPVRLHPTKPYFSITPCYLGGFEIQPGETYTAKYHFEVFDGMPE